MVEPTHSVGSRERETIRLIITRRNAAEILLAGKGQEWELPQLPALPGERLAEQLTSGTSKQWGLEAYCLFFPPQEASPETRRKPRYAVLEALAPNAEPIEGLYWMLSAAAARKALLPEDDRAAVVRTFAEMKRFVAEPGPGSFGRPGWIWDLFEWVQNVIRPLGLRVTGAFKQLNANTSFSLMRIETTGPALWFKATGEPNRHEFSVTRCVARLFPGYVPQLMATRPEWNGWLSWEAPGTDLDNLREASAWKKAARALADLQIASIGKGEELLQCSCRDFRARQLYPGISPFLAHMRDCMEAQEKRSPPPLSPSELNRLGDSLRETCSTLEELDLPNTIGHLDFNPGNILISPERCIFLDWAEACVASPFITYSYIREHFRLRFGGTAAEESIAAAYLAPWQALFPSQDLAHGMILSRLVAVFAYAVRCRETCPASDCEPAGHAGYLRSLTRRMYREALALEQRNAPCLP